MAILKTLPPAQLQDDVLVVRIRKSWYDFCHKYLHNPDDTQIYHMARGRWTITREETEKCQIVFAVVNNHIKGVFTPQEWCSAGTTENPVLPEFTSAEANRLEFIKKETPPEVLKRYLGKKLEGFFKRGDMRAFKIFQKQSKG